MKSRPNFTLQVLKYLLMQIIDISATKGNIIDLCFTSNQSNTIKEGKRNKQKERQRNKKQRNKNKCQKEVILQE